MLEAASLTVGGAVGFLGVVILTMVLYKYDVDATIRSRNEHSGQNQPVHRIPSRTGNIVTLVSLLLGCNVSSLLVYEYILSSGSFAWFILGESSMVLILGVPVFLVWHSKGRPSDS